MTLVQPEPREAEPREAEPRETGRVREPEVLAFGRVAGDQPRMTGRRLAGLLLLLGVLTVLGGQLGFLSSRLFDDVWQARVEIEYRGNSWTETEDVAVRSRSLTGPIAAAYGIPIKQFEEDLQAGLVGGTQILRIEYFDSDAALAQSIVSDLAEAYIAEASELPPENTLTLLQAQLGELQDELQTAQARLAREAPEPGLALTAEQQDLQAEIASLRARTGVLELRILDAELAEETVEAQGLPRYITRPFVFEEPFFPRPLRLALIGAAIGAMLGLVPFVWNLYRPLEP